MLYDRDYVERLGFMFVKSVLSPGLVRILIILSLLLTGSCSAYQSFPSVDLNLKGKIYRIEIADTFERKSQGLMFRQSIERNAGMLFPYDAPVKLNIWMKNTLISLAVIWLDEQARIIDMNILQPCRTPGCPSFGPLQSSMYVLELHPAEMGRFKIGDQLSSIRGWKSSK